MRGLFWSLVFTALALGATAPTAQAQSTKQFGIVAGVDFATLTGNDADLLETGTRTGFMGGLFATFPLGGSGQWVLEPELLYSMQGASIFNDGSLGAGVDATLVLDYISVPVLVRWSAKPDGTGFYVLGGPSVDFNVNCKFSVSAEGESADAKCEDFSDLAGVSLSANTLFSGRLGAGYSAGRFGVEGRWVYSWGDVLKGTADNIESNLDAKSSTFAILLRFTK